MTPKVSTIITAWPVRAWDWYRRISNSRRRPYSEIDQGIQRLVEQMNATGKIVTIASCEGHAEYRSSPYVYFQASPEIAGSVEQALRNASGSGDKRLSVRWQVEGRFNGDCELCFALRAEDYEAAAERLFSAFWAFAIRRRALDAELSALADIVTEACERRPAPLSVFQLLFDAGEEACESPNSP